jgi:hypothetical protein
MSAKKNRVTAGERKALRKQAATCARNTRTWPNPHERRQMIADGMDFGRQLIKKRRRAK